MNLDDVHTFRLTIKYLQNFSSAYEGHCTLNEICAQIEDSTFTCKVPKNERHYISGMLPPSDLAVY